MDHTLLKTMRNKIGVSHTNKRKVAKTVVYMIANDCEAKVMKDKHDNCEKAGIANFV